MPDILITGTNRGIGLELTRQYISRGARVFATVRESSTELDALKAACPDQLIILTADVTDAAQLKLAHEEITRQTTHLDILINNAGVLHPSSKLAEIEPDALQASFAVNSIAPIQVIRQLIDLLSSGSKIVNITAPLPALNKLKQPQNQVYMASRAALNYLTRMVALELAETGIITVGLYPGYIKTDMNHYAAEAQEAAQALPQVISTIDNLTAEHNGGCLLPDGRVYEW